MLSRNLMRHQTPPIPGLNYTEEIGKIIRSFVTVVNSTVALGMAFHGILEFDGVFSSNVPLSPLLKKLVELVAIAQDDLRAWFPLPAKASAHAERVKRVSGALDRLQQRVICLARNHKMEQEVVERHLVRAIPFFSSRGSSRWCVVELCPAAIETLGLNPSALFFPEAVFRRSLVILYCLGPYVHGKGESVGERWGLYLFNVITDAIGEWLLKHVPEALRVSGAKHARNLC